MDSTRWSAAAAETERLLREKPLLESVLLAIEADGHDAVAEDAAAVADALLEAQAAGGSWQQSLCRTAEHLLLLRHVIAEANTQQQAAVSAAVGWILARQNAPGAFGSGCTADTHALGLCSHRVRGFFAPCPAQRPLSLLRLITGQRIGTDQDVRIAVSALALAAVRAWGTESRELELHEDGLLHLLELASGPAPDILSTTALALVLRSLLLQPSPSDRRVAVLRAGLNRLAGGQRADGTWQGADLFLVLDVMVDAGLAGLLTVGPLAALERAAQLLLPRRTPEAPWTDRANGEVLRVGARALRFLAKGAQPMVGPSIPTPASSP